MRRRPPSPDDLPLFAESMTDDLSEDDIEGRSSKDSRGRSSSRGRRRDLAESLPLFPEAAAASPASEPAAARRPGISTPNLIYDGPMDDGPEEPSMESAVEEAWDEPEEDGYDEALDEDGYDEDGYDEGYDDEDAYAAGSDSEAGYDDEYEEAARVSEARVSEKTRISEKRSRGGSRSEDDGFSEDDDLAEDYRASEAYDAHEPYDPADYPLEAHGSEGYGPEPYEGPVAGGRASAGRPARVSSRLLGGMADLAVHAAVLGILLIGNYLLGVAPDLERQWPPLLLFLLVFSFFYTVVPLAFWGQTPGMASLGLSARSAGGENLSFVQTTVRWLVALVTLALVGLPLLVALSGRSLSDRLSGSHTLEP